MAFLLILILVLALPHSAYALLPPDLMVSVGSSLLQILGIVALGITVVYSALLVAIKQGFFVLKKYVLVFILIGNLVAGSILYFYISQQEGVFLSLSQKSEQLEIENARLKNNQLKNANNASTSAPLFTCGAQGEEMGQCVPGKAFHGLNFVVQGKDVVFEFDINQIEVEPNSGVYTQYMYLNGQMRGTSVTRYSERISTSTEPVVDNFLQQYVMTPSEDLSPRAVYRMTIDVDGVPALIDISGVQGDFISRNELTYTRTHSSAVAMITINGVTESAFAYVEKTYSSDVHTSIFFPGYDTIDAKTAQFILWDEEGTFYLFDQTEVRKAPPQYKSHTWLLKKDSAGKAEKSYVGSYQEIITSPKLSWELSLPGFGQAKMSLTADDLFKSYDGRTRAKISGVVTDQKGTRTIKGVAHIID